MAAYWKENGPPVHIAVAGYLGLLGKKGKSKPVTKMSSKSDEAENASKLMALAAEFQGSGGIYHG